jgi:hypothetical protein
MAGLRSKKMQAGSLLERANLKCSLMVRKIAVPHDNGAASALEHRVFACGTMVSPIFGLAYFVMIQALQVL